MKTKIIFPLLCAIIFTNCEKTRLGPTSENQPVQHFTSKKSINPYLYLGNIHNQGLDLVAANTKFPNISDSLEYDILNAYYVDAYKNATGEVIGIPSFDQIAVAKQTSLFYTYTSAPIINYLNDNVSKFSGKQIQLLSELNNHIVSTTNLAGLINTLDNFDNNVIKRNDINEGEKVLILSASAIARKSAEYWNLARINPNNPYHVLFEGDPVIPGGFPKWPWIIVGDVVGFIVGNGILPGSGAAVGFLVSKSVWELA